MKIKLTIELNSGKKITLSPSEAKELRDSINDYFPVNTWRYSWDTPVIGTPATSWTTVSTPFVNTSGVVYGTVEEDPDELGYTLNTTLRSVQ